MKIITIASRLDNRSSGENGVALVLFDVVRLVGVVVVGQNAFRDRNRLAGQHRLVDDARPGNLEKENSDQKLRFSPIHDATFSRVTFSRNLENINILMSNRNTLCHAVICKQIIFLKINCPSLMLCCSSDVQLCRIRKTPLVASPLILSSSQISLCINAGLAAETLSKLLGD